VLLCLLNGASFLALRTSGEVRERALRLGRRVGGGADAGPEVPAGAARRAR
jgi:hypothetical protein